MAFLCAELKVTLHPRSDHAGYIQHWMEVMKADKKAVFSAAARGNEAASYLTSQRALGTIEDKKGPSEFDRRPLYCALS